MEIIEFDRSRLPEIEGLWRELNAHHAQHASDFKNYFETLTFEDRIEQLLHKENLSLFVISDSGEYVGYCIATTEKSKGEIDSIYVKASHRGQKIGHQLITRAMDWLRLHHCSEIVLYVAEGNEKVLSFYEKYSFSKRYTVMGTSKER